MFIAKNRKHATVPNAVWDKAKGFELPPHKGFCPGWRVHQNWATEGMTWLSGCQNSEVNPYLRFWSIYFCAQVEDDDDGDTYFEQAMVGSHLSSPCIFVLMDKQQQQQVLKTCLSERQVNTETSLHTLGFNIYQRICIHLCRKPGGGSRKREVWRLSRRKCNRFMAGESSLLCPR